MLIILILISNFARCDEANLNCGCGCSLGVSSLLNYDFFSLNTLQSLL